MAESDREVRIRAGRRDGDGAFRLSVFAADLLAVTLEGRGERAPTLLLTRAQAEQLRDALDRLLPHIETGPRGEAGWQGAERRRLAS